MKGKRGIIERVDRTRGTTKARGENERTVRGKVDQRERDYVRYMSLTTFSTTFGCFWVFHPAIL